MDGTVWNWSTDKILIQYRRHSRRVCCFKAFVLQTPKAFSQQLEAFAREVDTVDMRSRRNILLLQGDVEQKDEATDEVIMGEVQQHMKMDALTTADIKFYHRMGHQTSNKKPRPILTKLNSVSIRDSIWFTKTKLKGSGITLSEFLTPRHAAFSKSEIDATNLVQEDQRWICLRPRWWFVVLGDSDEAVKQNLKSKLFCNILFFI